jgi:hypothetical protein
MTTPNFSVEDTTQLEEGFDKLDTFVTKKDCMEAIDYLHGLGMIDNMRGDEAHYTMILLKKVARIYKLNLWIPK